MPDSWARKYISLLGKAQPHQYAMAEEAIATLIRLNLTGEHDEVKEMFYGFPGNTIEERVDNIMLCVNKALESEHVPLKEEQASFMREFLIDILK